jgi:membrane protein implicated in regulation of membrane protease activity|tara:strand:- start:12 stop:173 length:162 start_codon:yes stop_codon:yes gene_type:complete
MIETVLFLIMWFGLFMTALLLGDGIFAIIFSLLVIYYTRKFVRKLWGADDEYL